MKVDTSQSCPDSLFTLPHLSEPYNTAYITMITLMITSWLQVYNHYKDYIVREVINQISALGLSWRYLARLFMRIQRKAGLPNLSQSK